MKISLYYIHLPLSLSYKLILKYMSAIIDVQEKLLQDKIKYIVKGGQYADQSKGKVKRVTSNQPQIYYFNLTNESIEVRMIQKTVISQLNSEEQLNQSQILKQSTIVQTYEFQQISKLDKRTQSFQNSMLYLIGIYDFTPNSIQKHKYVVIFRLPNQFIWNQFYEIANKKIIEEREYLKKSVTNFLGIEENIRKIIEKIIACTPSKRIVYNRITSKLNDKKIVLSIKQSKMMVYALMGNHPQMQNILRKQRIQSYDIDKRKYDGSLKQQLSSIVEVIDQSKDFILQGYSEKRKMDGIIVKRANLKIQKQQNSENKLEQQLYLNKIPNRSQIDIDEFIGIKNEIWKMEIEEKPIKQLPVSYKGEKVKVPVKDYSISGKQLEWIRREQTTINQSLDKNQTATIQVIKFMYQLMKANSQHKIVNHLEQGPMEKVLECLKDILIECSEDKKLLQSNKHVAELIKMGNKNYLEYRKNSNKFYLI